MRLLLNKKSQETIKEKFFVLFRDALSSLFLSLMRDECLWALFNLCYDTGYNKMKNRQRKSPERRMKRGKWGQNITRKYNIRA